VLASGAGHLRRRGLLEVSAGVQMMSDEQMLRVNEDHGAPFDGTSNFVTHLSTVTFLGAIG